MHLIIKTKPCPRVHEIYNFNKGFYAYHNLILSLSAIWLGVKKRILRELHQFYSCYLQIKAPNRYIIGTQFITLAVPNLNKGELYYCTSQSITGTNVPSLL